jgi:hypothetical protein
LFLEEKMRAPEHAALHTGGLVFGTNLRAEIFRNKRGHTYRDGSSKYDIGRKIDDIDLGSGLVTNVGVMALANDFAWANPSGSGLHTLALCNNHGSGIGTTAAAATDIALQTAIAGTPTTATAGAQSLISAANLQKLQTTATIAYGSNNAVTEWGLFSDTVYSITTGTPFTATSATGGTATGTPYTASSSTVQGEQQHILVAGTTASYGLITSNTTSGLVIPAWYKTADGTAGTTPGSTEAFTIKPVMWDHKVFAAINVVGGTDSILYTYQLTCTSGG